MWGQNSRNSTEIFCLYSAVLQGLNRALLNRVTHCNHGPTKAPADAAICPSFSVRMFLPTFWRRANYCSNTPRQSYGHAILIPAISHAPAIAAPAPPTAGAPWYHERAGAASEKTTTSAQERREQRLRKKKKRCCGGNRSKNRPRGGVIFYHPCVTRVRAGPGNTESDILNPPFTTVTLRFGSKLLGNRAELDHCYWEGERERAPVQVFLRTTHLAPYKSGSAGERDGSKGQGNCGRGSTQQRGLQGLRKRVTGRTT